MRVAFVVAVTLAAVVAPSGRADAMVGGLVRKAVSAVTKSATPAARKAVAPTGAAAAKKAGVAAAKPLAAKKAARVGAELAEEAGPSRGLKLAADVSSDAAQVLWERKGAIGVGAAATAVVLAPDDFLEAGGQVASTAIETVGQHVAGPLVTRAAQATTAPIAPLGETEGVSLAGQLLRVALIGGAALYAYRRYRRGRAAG